MAGPKVGKQGKALGPGHLPRGYGPAVVSTKAKKPAKKNSVYRVNYYGPGWGDVTPLGTRGSRGAKQK
jgi:hypothetical protein